MPFMFEYRHAFLLSNRGNKIISAKNKEIG